MYKSDWTCNAIMEHVNLGSSWTILHRAARTRVQGELAQMHEEDLCMGVMTGKL